MAKRIDDSHHPFKRRVKLGPGPRRIKRARQKDWECKRVKKYEQVCKWVGEGNRKPIRVKVKKAWKKKYNDQYRKWRAGKPTGPQGRAPGYRCRKTTVAKCK